MTKRRRVGQVRNLRDDWQSSQPGNARPLAADTAVTFDTVREIALALENVEESTSYGTPAFKMGSALVARLHQDGCSLVVRMGFEEREELMAGDPETYYITDHYLNYPWVLVRLSRVQPDALRDLLGGARRSAAAEKRSNSGPRQASRRAPAPSGDLPPGRFTDLTNISKPPFLYGLPRFPDDSTCFQLCSFRRWARSVPRHAAEMNGRVAKRYQMTLSQLIGLSL